MSIRPAFQIDSPENLSAFREERIDARIDGWHGAFQIAVFGGRSTDTTKAARYFMPFCKTKLIIDERIGDFDNPVAADLLAQHFNIFTKNRNFRSEISIAPRQTIAGVGIHYRQRVWQSDKSGRGIFLSISTPITYVRNETGFCERVINSGGGRDCDKDKNVVANMTQALTQKEWCFGKITCDKRTKTRLADIEARVGLEWLQREPYHVESYFGVIIPTGNEQSGEFLFDAVVGRGKHFGVMFGSSGGLHMWKNASGDKVLRAEYNNHTQYLFRNTQHRSFDLISPFTDFH